VKAVYDTVSVVLVRQVHGVSGRLRSGASQGLRNYTTFMTLYSVTKARANERTLWDVSEIIRQRKQPLMSGVPEIYYFTIGHGNHARKVAAVHGIIEVKRGLVYEQEYRFLVVFAHEVEQTLRTEFKQTGYNARKFAQEAMSA
jgi:hypothetical protein